jgi:hypothetical protein
VTPEGFDTVAISAGFVLPLLVAFVVGVFYAGWSVLTRLLEP